MCLKQNIPDRRAGQKNTHAQQKEREKAKESGRGRASEILRERNGCELKHCKSTFERSMNDIDIRIPSIYHNMFYSLITIALSLPPVEIIRLAVNALNRPANSMKFRFFYLAEESFN